MEDFNFRSEYNSLLTPETVSLLTYIHECRGQQAHFVKTRAEALSEFTEPARMQSVDASNRIEGIVTADERLKRITLGKVSPRTRSEREIVGYRDALEAVRGNYEHIAPIPTAITQLHRTLYRFSPKRIAGRYRDNDDPATDELTYCKLPELSHPSPEEIPAVMTALCGSFGEVIDDSALDPLLLIPLFVLSFLRVCPFDDGNARLSRLLTLVMLRRAGHIVVEHVSVEKLILESRDDYFAALGASLEVADGKGSDPMPFTKYTLEIVAAAYREFQERIDLLAAKGFSKPERVREIIKESSGRITKSEILEKCLDISQVTVQRTLVELLQSGEITKINGGRYTSYVWNGDKKPDDE